jgi:hypothetical protein
MAKKDKKPISLVDWKNVFSNMSSDQSRKFWRDKIAQFLKSRAVNSALDFIRKKAIWAVTGNVGWITTLVINKLWNRFGDPLVRYLIRKEALGVDIAKGKIRISKIGVAKDENDSEKYWDTISDI